MYWIKKTKLKGYSLELDYKWKKPKSELRQIP